MSLDIDLSKGDGIDKITNDVWNLVIDGGSSNSSHFICQLFDPKRRYMNIKSLRTQNVNMCNCIPSAISIMFPNLSYFSVRHGEEEIVQNNDENENNSKKLPSILSYSSPQELCKTLTLTSKNLCSFINDNALFWEKLHFVINTNDEVDSIRNILNTYFHHVKELYFSKTFVCPDTISIDSVIDPLSRNSGLKSLSIACLPLTDSFVTNLSEKFPNLEDLDIQYNHLDDPCLSTLIREISKLNYLKKIKLTLNINWGDELFRMLSEGLPRIEEIKLILPGSIVHRKSFEKFILSKKETLTRFTLSVDSLNVSLSPFEQCLKLEHLEFDSYYKIENLDALDNLNLKTLKLLGSSKNDVSDWELVRFFDYCNARKHLQSLYLCNFTEFNRRVLNRIVDKSPNLTTLHLDYCPKVTTEGIEHCITKLKKLKTLSIRNYGMDNEELYYKFLSCRPFTMESSKDRFIFCFEDTAEKTEQWM